MEQSKAVEQFEEAINEFKGTKYILIDKKVVKLLQVINKNPEIYNYVVECCINFDFERTLSACVKDGTFKFPDKDYLLVAFVYELLKRFENKSYNITEFLEKYFANNFDNLDSFEYFCLAVINRFEASIMKHLTAHTNKAEDNGLSITDINIFKRVEFLLESLRQSDLHNNTYDVRTMDDFLHAMIILTQKGEYPSVTLLVHMLCAIKFKNKLNQQIVKELNQILKVK